MNYQQKSLNKIDNWLNALIYEEGGKMNAGSLRTIELIRKEAENLLSHKSGIINEPVSNEVSDDFLVWLDKVIKFSKESIFMGGECDDMQIRLMEQIRHKYVSLNSGLNTINESIKDEELVEGGKWETWNHTSSLAATGDYMSSCGIKNSRYSLYLDEEDEDEILPILAQILNKQYAASKLNNTIEDKSKLLCVGRRVKVDTEYYTVTSAMELSDSVLFNLQKSNGSLRVEIKK